METAHIYIYGDIGYWQSADAADWGEVTLKDVKNQVEQQSDAEELTVHIHSPGGYVTEGFAIHDFLKSQGKPVTTIIEGMCYSIATVIALAGDTRLMTSNSDFMIHNPWGGAVGDSNEIQKYADDLKNLEQKAADFYAAKTNITAEQALELMKAETFMTPEEALDKGFITEIASVMKAVAKFNPNSKKMAKKAKSEKKAKSILAKLENMLGLGAQNKMVLDANGAEIDFPDLEDDDTPSVGDSATIDGSPADGEHVMPNGETYVFADGALSEIIESEEEEEEESEEMAQLQEENTQLKKDIKAVKKSEKALKKENATIKASLKDLQDDVLDLKKSIKSEFNHNAGDGNSNKKSKKNNGNGGSKLSWKKKED